jgi:hypothetical protein
MLYLDHESLDDAMELDIVVVAIPSMSLNKSYILELSFILIVPLQNVSKDE